MELVKFKKGTHLELDSIGVKDNNTIYFYTDQGGDLFR